jgi:hypothetical protein
MKKLNKHSISIISACILLLMLAACGSPSSSLVSSITLEPGKAISFAQDIAGGQANGWSLPNSGGTWSDSDSPVLNLDYDKPFNDGLNLTLSLLSFVNPKNPSISVSVYANEEFVKELKFDEAKSSADVSLDISRKILSKNTGILTLRFDITNAAIPKLLGVNLDERKLGIFLMTMIATPAP